ncbi:MAG TPA: NADPH:quinone reductase [Acidimicrobiales bacterium]|nr:NADPH:quinone reductase [Acidimicrobiales bacterium]
MRAIVYSRNGGPEVLEVVDRPDPAPGPGEVLVRVARSGVNPTDWKSRQGATATLAFAEQVPNQDGAGTVVGVGAGVDAGRVGERVWLWEAAWQRPRGTAAELTVVPADHAVALPDSASFDLGAAVGVPALTAHRALTVAEGAPARLAPGALTGWSVLVAGGAGAVGHAAIELARWAGARVVATVSSDEKAALARAAGAAHVVRYRDPDAAEQVRAAAPDGVQVVVEVAPAANAALDGAVLAPGGTVASYANDADTVAVPIRASMVANARYQFVLLYGVPTAAKAAAVEGVAAALADGALRVGEQAGLPLHHFPLEATADAHRAVEGGAVGKVLIDVDG